MRWPTNKNYQETLLQSLLVWGFLVNGFDWTCDWWFSWVYGWVENRNTWNASRFRIWRPGGILEMYSELSLKLRLRQSLTKTSQKESQFCYALLELIDFSFCLNLNCLKMFCRVSVWERKIIVWKNCLPWIWVFYASCWINNFWKYKMLHHFLFSWVSSSVSIGSEAALEKIFGILGKNWFQHSIWLWHSWNRIVLGIPWTNSFVPREKDQEETSIIGKGE